MNASLKVLNNYVKVDDQDPLELSEKITRIGHEVEGHHPLAVGTKLVVGYVKECIDHPNSDHLHICQVEIAPGEVTQIVCGAPTWQREKKLLSLYRAVNFMAVKLRLVKSAEKNQMG